MSEQAVSDQERRWIEAGFTTSELEAWAEVGVSDLELALEFREGQPFSLAEAQVWKNTTGLDAYVAIGWRDAGFSPQEAVPWLAAYAEMEGDDAAKWRDAGMSVEDFALWNEASEGDVYEPSDLVTYEKEVGITTDELRKWRSIRTQVFWSGVRISELRHVADPSDPNAFGDLQSRTEADRTLPESSEEGHWEESQLSLDEIKEWRAEGFDIDVDRTWIETFASSLEEAKNWRDGGFTPQEATAWSDLLVEPADASSWRSAGFTVDDARRFADEGIIDVDDALEQASPPTAESYLPDEPRYLLRPVSTVASHVGEICDAYVGFRRRGDRVAALRRALEKVLSPDEYKDVIDYFEGKWDDQAGAGDGRKLAYGLIESCEEFFSKVKLVEARNSKSRGS